MNRKENTEECIEYIKEVYPTVSELNIYHALMNSEFVESIEDGDDGIVSLSYYLNNHKFDSTSYAWQTLIEQALIQVEAFEDEKN
mgnify:CR=1 FL=1